MKQLIAILFCAGLITQNSGIFLVLAGYNLNKNYIAANLCENKNKPSMHCNGKCYLAKKLREEEKQQAPASRNLKISPVLQLFFAEDKLEIASQIGNSYQSVYSRYNVLQTVHLSNYIFHPPNT